MRRNPREPSGEVPIGAETRVRVEQHGLLHLVRVVAAAVFVEAAVVDRLVECRPAHHALLEVAAARCQTLVGACTPGLEGLDAGGVLDGGLEGARVHNGREAAHVAEAERCGQRRLHRVARTDVQWLAQPHHEVVTLELRVDAFERGIRRDHTAFEQLGDAVDLEDARTALRVAGERLLRDHEQRLAVLAAYGVGQRVVQLGLVGVVRVRGGVVLRHDGDVVGVDSEPCQVTHELRRAATHAGGQGAETGCRDRGVRAVGVRMHESDHAGDRQAQT